MTGGVVVVLGETGRNFAAGMSGGIAYVSTRTGTLRRRAATSSMVDLEPVGRGGGADASASTTSGGDLHDPRPRRRDGRHDALRRRAPAIQLIANHLRYTGSSARGGQSSTTGSRQCVPKFRQGDAGRVPARAERDCEASERSAHAARSAGGSDDRWVRSPASSKSTGRTGATSRPRDRIRHYKNSSCRCRDEATTDQAARCMDCGIPYCHNGCPVNNLIPDWNDLVYRGDWQEALAQPALDQQFPGVHRPHLPRALRGVLHAEHRRQAGHHQDDRMRDRRPRLGGRLDRAASRPQRRPASASPSSAPGPAGLACAQQLARAGHDGARVREERPGRRPAALRHSRLQDGEAPHRPARRARWRPRASSSTTTSMSASTLPVEAAARRLRRGGAGRRRREAARPADPGPRAGRHPFRDGLPAAAEPPRRRRRAGRRPTRPILANGKHVVVIGGGDTGSDCIGTSIRQGALSVTQLEIMPQPPEKENKLLTWPDWPLKLRTSSVARGRRRARLRRADQASSSAQNGQVEGAATACASTSKLPADRRAREFELKADLVLLAMGFVVAAARGLLEQARRRRSTRAATSRPTRCDYQTSRREGLRLRRHAARPVAGRLGDPRGPPVRAFGRRVPDGRDDAAALTRPASRQTVSG